MRAYQITSGVAGLLLLVTSGAAAQTIPNVATGGVIRAADTNAIIDALNDAAIPTGNLALVDSTDATGNVTKGGARFLHNFGLENTFLGKHAGNFTMTGGFNTGVGSKALEDNTSGTDNTAVGRDALRDNTTGHLNTAVGALALLSSVSGSGNTAVGRNSLSLATGTGNIALGSEAGKNVTAGNYNILIGHAGFASDDEVIRIGDGGQTRTFIAGISGVTITGGVNVLIDAAGQLHTAASSRRYKRDIQAMGEASRGLMRLRPVTFRYREAPAEATEYGLIAEEVAEVYPDLVVYDESGNPETV